MKPDQAEAREQGKNELPPLSERRAMRRSFAALCSGDVGCAVVVLLLLAAFWALWWLAHVGLPPGRWPQANAEQSE